MFQSSQIMLVVVDLGQHQLLHSHPKIWLRLNRVTLGTLRLSSLSKFIKIDGLFGTLDTWKSSKYWLWILKVLTRPPSFQRTIFTFYSESREKLYWIGDRRGTNWCNKGRNVFSELVWFLHFLYVSSFSWAKISLFFFFFLISVLYSDHCVCLIGITE